MPAGTVVADEIKLAEQSAAAEKSQYNKNTQSQTARVVKGEIIRKFLKCKICGE